MPLSAVRPNAAGPGRTRSRRSAALLLVLLAALTLLTGCSRVRAALAIQPDDTVRGEIVLATPTRGPADTGPVITIPPEISADVDVETYRQDDYVGSRLTFSGLSLTDVSMLTTVVAGADGRTEFTLRRIGNRVLAEGTVDLATVSADRADFQLKITFPGELIETNGDAEAGTVTWVLEPGEKGEIRAEAGFVDPDGPSALLWTLLLTTLVAAVAGAVVWLARQDRNPPVDRSPR